MLKRATKAHSNSSSCFMIVYKLSEYFYIFLLLVNYSTKISFSIAKDEIKELRRFLYHWRAGPDKLKPNPLHTQASMSSHGITAINIHCLYCATLSSGSNVPLNIYIVSKLNFLVISIMLMASKKGK